MVVITTVDFKIFLDFLIFCLIFVQSFGLNIRVYVKKPPNHVLRFNI